MTKLQKYSVLTGLITILIGAGFTKEFIFKDINAKTGYTGNPEYSDKTHNNPADFFNFIITDNSYTFKWVFTALFILLFLALSGLILFLITGEKRYIFFLAGFYCIFIFIAGVLVLTGLFSGYYRIFYKPTHALIEVLQSPVPVLIFILLFFSTGKAGQREISRTHRG
ncbi:MAG: hypothetical protein HYY40_09825 [Bacteroidetes bacterium]|nr:hypothetical protein [Bacteroidota bacterium]